MGASNSKRRLFASDIVKTLKKEMEKEKEKGGDGKLSDNDKKMFDFAKVQVTEHMLDKTSLLINFRDREPLHCAPAACEDNEIQDEMYIGFNSNDILIMKISHNSIGWKIVTCVADGLRLVINVLPNFLRQITDR
ncbi:hypothetical protein DPMN_177208 [Dreissena polymorpha]|uniref:Uncharacterized protein n=1 Tax=Dreissena polymorpha TaxID=45954 RepID=A0A9D4E9U2_DREPO|nr:hypothetical protein DPMN_177208 [Dreissena polymorpha]